MILDMGNKKLERLLKRIAEIENTLNTFVINLQSDVLQNITSNTFEQAFENADKITELYTEALNACCKQFKKTSDEESKQIIKGKINDIVDSLFFHITTGDWRSGQIFIPMLLCINPHLTLIEELIPGTSKKLYDALQKSIHYMLMQYSNSDLFAAIDGLKLMRRISINSDDNEMDKNGISICLLFELWAVICVINAEILTHPTDKQGQLSHAINIYEEGIDFAQAVDIAYAERFASKVSKLRQILHGSPPEPLYAEPLGQFIAQSSKVQHQEAFLPTTDELITEYASEPNKLLKIITDSRLEPTKTRVMEWAKKYPNSPLKELFGIKESRKSDKSGLRILDAKANLLGVISLDREFMWQYISEIQYSIYSLFTVWKQKGELTKDVVFTLLTNLCPKYDWRIVEAGLRHYFDSNDYLAASHVLVPQLEGSIVKLASQHKIEKKLRKGQVGELYLSDLVTRSDFRSLVGEEFADLLFWCMTNRNAPRFNYRNNIAHGFIAFGDYHWELVASVTVWLLLKGAYISAQLQQINQGVSSDEPDTVDA